MEILPNRILFYGHELFPAGLSINVAYAFYGLLILYMFLDARKKGTTRWMIFWGYWYIMHLPNAMYLFFEVKHLILKDGIADGFEFPAVLGFGILSFIGLLLTIIQILVTVNNIKLLRANAILSIYILSALASWGAILGLRDLTSMMGALFPPIIITQSIEIAKSWEYLALFGATTFLLGTLGYAIQRIFLVHLSHIPQEKLATCVTSVQINPS